MNFYFVGLEYFSDELFKVMICVVFFLVDDFVIFEMLLKLGVYLKSEFKYEKIRNFVNNKMISVLNGNCFIYIELFVLKFLLCFSYCVGFKCKILYCG